MGSCGSKAARFGLKLHPELQGAVQVRKALLFLQPHSRNGGRLCLVTEAYASHSD